MHIQSEGRLFLNLLSPVVNDLRAGPFRLSLLCFFFFLLEVYERVPIFTQKCIWKGEGLNVRPEPPRTRVLCAVCRFSCFGRTYSTSGSFCFCLSDNMYIWDNKAKAALGVEERNFSPSLPLNPFSPLPPLAYATILVECRLHAVPFFSRPQ